jgi:hypothetical protein
MTAVLQIGLLEMLQNGQSHLFDGVGIFAFAVAGTIKADRKSGQKAQQHAFMIG